uniref:Uncharacterized protein n=1 Tax=Tetraselmis sp. GSL018 TaxID=582737 RepID=A0A061RDH8_9CHLO
MLSRLLVFSAGALFGAYVAQNYEIPKVRDLFENASAKFWNWEQEYRKSK